MKKLVIKLCYAILRRWEPELFRPEKTIQTFFYADEKKYMVRKLGYEQVMDEREALHALRYDVGGLEGLKGAMKARLVDGLCGFIRENALSIVDFEERESYFGQMPTISATAYILTRYDNPNES